MPFITITIEGIDQVVSGLDHIIGGLENTKHNALQEGSDFMANEMRANAHVITGRMKGSIRNSVSGDTAIIEVPVEYAQYENKRPGSKQGSPHNFADQALSTTEQQFPHIINQIYSDLLR